MSCSDPTSPDLKGDSGEEQEQDLRLKMEKDSLEFATGAKLDQILAQKQRQCLEGNVLLGEIALRKAAAAAAAATTSVSSRGKRVNKAVGEDGGTGLNLSGTLKFFKGRNIYSP